jgi:hypothetical protein
MSVNKRTTGKILYTFTNDVLGNSSIFLCIINVKIENDSEMLKLVSGLITLKSTALFMA